MFPGSWLIAEDLLLLLVKDSCGQRPSPRGAGAALATAVLVELASHGHLDVEEDGLRPRLFVADDTPVAHPVLDDALAVAARAEGSRIVEVIDLVSRGLWPRLLEGLTERGIMVKSSRARFWLPAKITWRVESPTRRQDVREQLGAILSQGVPPDARGGALISLLNVVDAMGEVVDESNIEANDRAASISEGDWPADEVIKAILESGVYAVHTPPDGGSAGG